MKSIRYIVICMLLLGSNISCRTGSRDNQSLKIEIFGHLDAIKAGNFSTVYDLDSLETMNHVYALGAMDSLKGEIQIFDDQPFHSIVDSDSILVGTVGVNRAMLLVFKQVNDWDKYDLPLSVTNLEALIGYFQYGDQFEEVRSDEPFVFLLEGEAEQVDWHIIRPIAEDSLVSGSDHAHNALKGSLEDVIVEIFGIYSKEQEGIITHSGIPIHMHFKTADGQIAGHVDHLELGPEMTLSIPRSK